MVAGTITPFLKIIQKLTILLALLQNLVQVLERPFRKDISSKKCSDLLAAPFTMHLVQSADCRLSLVIQIARVIISNKSPNEQGSKYGFVKVAAVKSVHPHTTEHN